MPHCTRTKHDVAGRQADMFRLAERDYDLTLKRLSLLSGHSVETLGSYKAGAAMPLHAFVQLAPHIPDDLLSLVLEPANKHVGTNEPGDGDVSALAREASGFAADYIERAADGTICHIDKAALGQRARRITPIARRVAA